MKKVINIIIILLLTFSFVNVNAASTLQDLKDELAQMKANKAANDNAKKKTQSEINAEKAKIKAAYDEIEKAKNDIEVAKNEIAESEVKIAEFKEESERLLVFFQIISGENDVIEYVSGSSSISEMLMRYENVSQIFDYNQSQLTELEETIERNNELQIELVKKENELNKNITEYQKKVASLNNDLSSLVEVSLDVDSQIKAQEEIIQYYESAGCKNSDLLSECIKNVDNAYFLRPTNKGYISSGFGYRSFYLNGAPYSDFHNALDVAGNPARTDVYAAANGYVAAIVRKSSCGGNQIYLHVVVKGQKYTVTYAHLWDVYVNVGDTVTNQTVIGSVGGGGATLKSNGGWDTCSTGYHLHFGIATGFYLGSGYSSYSKYVSNSIEPSFMPTYGHWYYSRI